MYLKLKKNPEMSLIIRSGENIQVKLVCKYFMTLQKKVFIILKKNWKEKL